jgi:hypothetical protein
MMTDVLSAFEYPHWLLVAGAILVVVGPHWLLVAGAILVVVGLVGIAFRQRTNTDLKPTEIAHENDRSRADRRAQLAERTKNRWAYEAKPTSGEGS